MMACVKVTATLTKCEDIKIGELFSRYGPDYWQRFGKELRGAIGEAVYVRTHAPTPTADMGTDIYRITIQTREEE